MIIRPVRYYEEVVRHRNAGKVRASYRIVDARGAYVASVVAGWGTSDELREMRAQEIVALINGSSKLRAALSAPSTDAKVR